jgi:hypothetical protein
MLRCLLACPETHVIPQTAHRFDTEFAPRIAATIASLFDSGVHAEVVPYAGHGHPTRVRITAESVEHLRHYPYRLDVSLTWDSDEIELLMGEQGEARFARYLAALARKLEGWSGAREIDFRSHSQAEPAMLIGGLDFEG